MKTFETENALGAVPAPKGYAAASLHDCSEGVEMAFIPHADREGFAAYCDLLVGSGYEKVAERCVKNNVFATFRSPTGLGVHTYFIGHSGEMRVVAIPDLKPLPAEQTATVCNALILQLNACHPVLQLKEGMSYLLRLEDGRFVVYDGGYRLGYSALTLYEAMQKYAPDKDHIRVAAWILTHDHNDHVGGFLEFAEMYGGRREICVERILHDLCDEPVFCEFINVGNAQKVRDTVALFYPDAAVHRMQCGQCYRFGETEIEVLFTPQDYMPRSIPNEPDATEEKPKKGNLNHLSVVTRVTFGNGKRFFVMADTTATCCDEMCLRYGDHLKSDYVQMAHHGISKPTPRAQNATVEIYDLISPTVALLPCSVAAAEDRLERELNRHLLGMVEACHVSGKGEKLIEI